MAPVQSHPTFDSVECHDKVGYVIGVIGGVIGIVHIFLARRQIWAAVKRCGRWIRAAFRRLFHGNSDDDHNRNGPTRITEEQIRDFATWSQAEYRTTLTFGDEELRVWGYENVQHH